MIEFVPGLRLLPRRWTETRNTRRELRNSRVEWASQDAIFFASIAAQASESMLWAVLLAIGTFGNVFGSFTLSAEYGSFLKAPLHGGAMCVHLEASLQLSAEYGSFLKVPVARDWRNLTCRCCRVHRYGCPLSKGVAGGGSTSGCKGGTGAEDWVHSLNSNLRRTCPKTCPRRSALDPKPANAPQPEKRKPLGKSAICRGVSTRVTVS